jgi:glycine hydroxymethyltransferase
MEDVPNFINEMVKQHHQLFANSLPMIASENLISPTARKLMVSDLMDRYAEGLPGERYYQGNEFVDKIEVRDEHNSPRCFRRSTYQLSGIRCRRIQGSKGVCITLGS